MNTHTQLYTRSMRLRKGFFKEKGFHGRSKRTDRGRNTERNRELVPDNWSLVREVQDRFSTNTKLFNKQLQKHDKQNSTQQHITYIRI